MGDRRQGQRHRVFIPIRMDGRADLQVGKITSGVTRDVSATGLLIRTRRRFTVGAPVTVVVHADDMGTQPRELSGIVVRLTENRADPGGLWPFEVAIRLDYPDAALQHYALANGFCDEG